jgi:oxygen-dependent protoporphyrinogen oxidase
LRGKLRIACEPFRDPRACNDGSVADFVRHRIGREGLDALLDPLVSGIHAGDPEQLSMRACFPRLVELVETHGGLFKALFKTRGDPAPSVMKPDGGCQAVTDALARSLGDKLRLGASVTSIARSGSTWRLLSSAGAFEAERLVLALPVQSAARLLSGVAPSLARTIGSIHSENVVSIVHAWPRERVGHPLDGFGYLVASREQLRHLGTLFSSSIAPDSRPGTHVLLRTLLGGARRPELVDASDGELRDVVLREVAPMLGLRGEPDLLSIQRWRATLPRLDLQHPARSAAIERETPPGLELLGNWRRGIGVNQLVATARDAARAALQPA